jgi:hypothetical protein
MVSMAKKIAIHQAEILGGCTRIVCGATVKYGEVPAMINASFTFSEVTCGTCKIIKGREQCRLQKTAN